MLNPYNYVPFQAFFKPDNIPVKIIKLFVIEEGLTTGGLINLEPASQTIADIRPTLGQRLLFAGHTCFTRVLYPMILCLPSSLFASNARSNSAHSVILQLVI